MKKHEIYVPIWNKKQAKQARNILLSIDEPIKGNYFIKNEYYDTGGLYFNEELDSWAIAIQFGNPSTPNKRKKITLKELIKLLVSQEIVNPKIAVKVENENDFHALMRHYYELGKKLNNGLKPLEFDLDLCTYPMFVNVDDLSFSFEGLEACYSDVSFADFAKEHTIKLPPIKSEDGVWLYEGDLFWGVDFNPSLKKWSIKNYNIEHGPFILTNIDCEGDEDFPYVSSPSRNKIFTSEQSALEWIEAQKPKEIIISPNSGYPIIVRKNPICGDEYIHLDMSKRGDYNGANIHLTITELREAVKAYDYLQELS